MKLRSVQDERWLVQFVPFASRASHWYEGARTVGAGRLPRPAFPEGANIEGAAVQVPLKHPSPDDAARFEALVRQHEAAIQRAALRLCGNREDAEDLVQEALLEAFSAFARFTEGTHFDRWVNRIMRNTYIDRVRARARTRTEPLDVAFDHATGEVIERHLVDPSASPDAELMASTLDGPIQDALQSLPPEFRTVVVLADIEEHTYEAISQMLHVPIGTVRSRLHRGRAILKQKLSQYVHH